MDAELSRMLGRAKGSPFWIEKVQAGNPKADAQIMDVATKAGTFSKLPERIQSFLKDCDRSIKVAQELQIKDFMDSAKRQKVLEAMYPSVEVS